MSFVRQWLHEKKIRKLQIEKKHRVIHLKLPCHQYRLAVFFWTSQDPGVRHNLPMVDGMSLTYVCALPGEGFVTNLGWIMRCQRWHQEYDQHWEIFIDVCWYGSQYFWLFWDVSFSLNVNIQNTRNLRNRPYLGKLFSFTKCLVKRKF